MSKLFIIFAAIFSMNTFALTCTGQKIGKTSSGSINEKIDLNLVSEQENFIKFEADLDEAYFSFQLLNDVVTAMITMGPEYTTGNLSKGTLDKDGKYKLAYVTPSLSYVMECSN